MKTNRLGILLFVLLISVVKLPAQTTETNASASNVSNTLTFGEIKAKAEKGDTSAEFQLGVKYNNGDGIAKDGPEAFKWWLKAAENGDTNASFMVATIYDNGSQFYGVTSNVVKAVKWYRKAAEQGDAEAQTRLGSYYEQGLGVPQDYGEAVKWYHKAAEQGEVAAQSNLAMCYYYGHGVAQDYAKAVKWRRMAAEQGDANAQGFIAMCYQQGLGVPQDYAEAAKWYRKCAQQGDAYAQNILGTCYKDGEGVTQDYIEAYKWFNLASAQGLKAGGMNRDNLLGLMTPDQIAEGQRRSAAFVPRKELPDSNSSSPVATGFPIATGTGFFITDGGYLISNYHVVKDATKVRLLTSAGLIDAKVVQVDAANDLALLKADGRFAPLPIVASRTVNLGGTVATVGFPDIGLQGFAPKLAKGEIASLSGAADDPRYFQISVPVQPGNSGGALVDERGNVIGIVSAKLDASVALVASGALPENVNYAVKSSLLLSFLESVPEVSAKLKAPNTKDEKFEDAVKSAQDAAVLVLVY